MLAAESAEWDVWVAVEPIFIDNTRAFNPGHAVPTSHVEKFDLDDGRVARRDGSGPKRPVVAPVTAPTGDPILIGEPDHPDSGVGPVVVPTSPAVAS
jgi:hypothetical protein